MVALDKAIAMTKTKRFISSEEIEMECELGRGSIRDGLDSVCNGITSMYVIGLLEARYETEIKRLNKCIKDLEATARSTPRSSQP